MTLTDLPNISKVISGHLTAAGIETPEMLRALGSRNAFLRIRLQADHTACLNMLYALEGAVQGVRWHALSAEDKDGLKAYYQSL